MKKLGIKYRLYLLTLIPLLCVCSLFSVFFAYEYTKDFENAIQHWEKNYHKDLLPAIELAIQQDNPQIINKFITSHLTRETLLIPRYKMYIGLILISLLGILLSLGLHYFLSRSIHRPIARLRRSMLQILSNEFETCIKTTSQGELGIIERGCLHLQKKYSNTINDLNQHIETATSDLQQSLELLEEKNIQLSLEKKKAEEKTRHKAEFIANMSHEIRTPMNGVIGFTNVLLESKLDSLQLDYVKTIKSSAQDLLSIINDILDYSKIDAGKLTLESIPLNIRACIDEVLTLITPSAHNKGIDLIPITAIDVPKTVLGDAWRLKQIISNLVSNAVKFTEHGHVLIRTQIEHETEDHYHLAIHVSDTGIGISLEEQNTLFNAYNQANPSMTRRFGGSGLGLIICKQLVEHMQGRIVIDSESHKGTTFSVYIQLAKLASYEAEKHQPSYVGLNAICFDDDPLHLEALCNGLMFWGIQCIPIRTLHQLQEAYTLYPHSNMALVTINPSLEQHIAEIIRHQSIPTILVSKYFIKDYSALGAQGLLFKPPNIQKLHDTIELILSPTSAKASLPSVMPTTKNSYLQAGYGTQSWETLPAFPSLATKITQNQELEDLRLKLRKINPNILIAEDNIINRMLLVSILGENAQIESVEDGEAALSICEQQKFEAILMDLHMPKLNGIEAAKKIREKSAFNQTTRIILITANTGDILNNDLDSAGIELCLQKPIDEKKLLQHLLRTIKQPPSSAINWALCIQRVSGNQALAFEFLARFVEELHLNRQEFITFYEANQLTNLQQIAHKLHGACCFCGVPTLQNAVAKVENAINNLTHVSEIQDEFSDLIHQIDAVIVEYDHSHQTFLHMEAVCQ